MHGHVHVFAQKVNNAKVKALIVQGFKHLEPRS